MFLERNYKKLLGFKKRANFTKNRQTSIYYTFTSLKLYSFFRKKMPSDKKNRRVKVEILADMINSY